jgi:cell division protein FtsW
MKMPDTGRVQTWENRITNFLTGEQGDNYQSNQSKIAIATGGVLGKMPGNSTQRNFLPHAYSDFIYSIIIEEYGLIGGFVVLLLYMMLLYRGIRIAHKSPGTFGTLLAAGLSFSLVFQAMINMAVAVDLLPVTGQPLPMVSMGGTSLWFTSLAIGIILSVSKKIEEEETEDEQSFAHAQIN